MKRSDDDARGRVAHGDPEELDGHVFGSGPGVQVAVFATGMNSTGRLGVGRDDHSVRIRVVVVVDSLRNLPDHHGSTLSFRGRTLRSVGEVLQVLDELHLEIDERSVARVVLQVDRSVEPHPLPDGVEAFEDELRFGAGEVFHGPILSLPG